MDSDRKSFLYRQLDHLGQMIADGEHDEPGGKWITRDYRAILKSLGILPKVKRRVAAPGVIDDAMTKRVAALPCPKCQGALKQTRSGSLRAVCSACGGKFQILRRGK